MQIVSISKFTIIHTNHTQYSRSEYKIWDMISTVQVKRSSAVTFVLNNFDQPGVTIFSNTQWTQQVYLIRACKDLLIKHYINTVTLEKAATDRSH